VTDHAITTPAPGSYRIDPDRSTVHYAGKHLFGTGTVHATFRIREGLLQVGDRLTASSATVTVDAESFTSDRARRDSDVRSSRLLDVATYPDITFASEHLREDPSGWHVAGTVTAHGHSVPVEVLVDEVSPDGAGVHLHGVAQHLDRTALGITGSRGMVGRYLDLELDVVAVPA
jgi:polyisoprenoid-binding protein YceI